MLCHTFNIMFLSDLYVPLAQESFKNTKSRVHSSLQPPTPALLLPCSLQNLMWPMLPPCSLQDQGYEMIMGNSLVFRHLYQVGHQEKGMDSMELRLPKRSCV